MQNARCQQGGPKRFKGPFLSPDEGQKRSQKQLQHQPTVICLRKWLNKPLSTQTAGWLGRVEGRRLDQALQVCQIPFSKYSRKCLWFLTPTFCKQRLLQKPEGEGSLLLPSSLSPPSLPSLFWRELLLKAVAEQKTNISCDTIRPAHTY